VQDISAWPGKLGMSQARLILDRIIKRGSSEMIFCDQDVW
jgi:hypothetical protein